MSHTRSAPLTTTRTPPFSLLGWASTVATWCSTRWKGSSCIHTLYQPLLPCHVILLFAIVMALSRRTWSLVTMLAVPR